MDNHQWSREVTLMKVSSGQGIVKPPIGWSNPNSSSDLLRRAWNEGWLKYEIGTTYLFFWLSPTYTERNPFGAAMVSFLLVEAVAVTERPRIFFAPNRLLTKAILYFFFVWNFKLFWRDVWKDSSYWIAVVGWWLKEWDLCFIYRVVNELKTLKNLWILWSWSVGQTRTQLHMVLSFAFGDL